LKKFTNWKEGLLGSANSMGAGQKMQIAIGATAALLVVAAVIGAVAAPAGATSFALSGAGATAAAGTAATGTAATTTEAANLARAAAAITALEQKFRVVELAIEEVEERVATFERSVEVR